MTQRLSRRLRNRGFAALSLQPGQLGRPAAKWSVAAMVLAGWCVQPVLAVKEPNFPITPEHRSVAKKVAEAGVPLSALADNAPDSYTVKKGDTLWDISSIFLKSPWRWPELWGMNLDQIRNPHLIFPGQILVLVKIGDRAHLEVAKELAPDGSVKLSPHVRSSALSDAIGAVPLHLIQPFLNEAVVLNSADELAGAPRIVAAQEGRVVLGRGDTAYVRGESHGQRDWRIFRQPKALTDPTTGEILGYEAAYVGGAELISIGGAFERGEQNKPVPDTYTITGVRQEAGIGDRMMPVPPRESTAYAPHAPSGPMEGQLVSIYGEAMSAGQNHIVALNRGARDGMERGHVLALLRDGREVVDRTDPGNPVVKLPNERIGTLFVFRVFDRVSYALILTSQDSVKVGDRFINP